MSDSLYKRYRPQTLKGVLGQDSAVAALNKAVESKNVPQCLLLTGPSGCGKTTLARILKTILDCGDADYQEINSADFKGIDMVRDIRRNVNLSPISGSCRIWMIDEAHQLTKDAQNAFLKMLEDTPSHVHFILASTDSKKLIAAIHTRASEVKLGSLPAPALQRVVQRVVDKEGFIVSLDVVNEIVEAADGSARKALVILEQVAKLEGDAEQIKAIQTTTFNKDVAFDLARKLVTGFGVKWPEIAPILRNLKEEDPEGIRYCVLGYARSCMVGAEGKVPNPALGQRAFMVIEIFSRNFYDSKAAGLAAACWEVVHAK